MAFNHTLINQIINGKCKTNKVNLVNKKGNQESTDLTSTLLTVIH